jgi:uncharacterized protein (DUF1778 family)
MHYGHMMNREKYLSMRLRESESQLIRLAAAKSEERVGEFARQAIISRARRVIRQAGNQAGASKGTSEAATGK